MRHEQEIKWCLERVQEDIKRAEMDELWQLTIKERLLVWILNE